MSEEKKSGLPTWAWVLIGAGGVSCLGCGGIAALMMFLVTPSVTRQLDRAYQARALLLVGTARASCEAYAVEHDGMYPDSLMDLEVSGYGALSEWEDPWGNLLVYEPPDPSSGRMEPIVGSYGADGVPGGNGENADVGFE